MTDRNSIEKRQKIFHEIWMLKTKREVKKKLDDIRIARIKNGLDNNMKSYSDLIEASLRFDPLLDILKKAEIKDKEKGHE